MGNRCDVYMFESIDKVVECCYCKLAEVNDPTFKKRSGALAHLQRHKEAGHKVPQYAFDRLKKDMSTDGDEVV